MIVIGLTGGIGSGKSTVSKTLAELGAVVIDADKVGHEALKPHTKVWQEVVAAFGKEVLLPNDEINRGKLGEIVFNSPAARLQLNQIIHPQMYQMMKQRLEELREQGTKVAVLEAAILLEAGWNSLTDEVWVTVAPEETVIHRLAARSGLSEEQVKARICSQLTTEERAGQADVIIDTDCSRDEVEAKVRSLWADLLTQKREKIESADPPINKRDIDISDEVVQRLQNIVNIMAEVLNVPAALIMKVEPPYREVFRSSESRDNPYKAGHREYLAGLYCERVIATGNKLLVPNALQDKEWDKNPDIKLGMISYLGLPLLWPDGEVFGTICVLDLKENRYSKRYEELMLQFKELAETHLDLLFQNQKVRSTLQESQQRNMEVLALLQSTRAVLEYHQFKEAARSIFNAGKNLIGATAGYVALLSKDGAENEALFLDSGRLPCTVDPSLPMPIRGLRGEAYRSGKAVYHNDFSRSEWAKFMPQGHASLDNVLFAPLMIRGKMVGLLGLANKPGGFTENDVHRASAAGEIAAIALLNSHTLELLEESEKRFRSIAETASDAIVSINSQGSIAFWNRAAETIFGYSADEIVGKPLTLIIPEQFREAHHIGMKRVISSGETKIIGKTVEMAGLRKDGREFPLELSLATWKTGQEVFFTSIIRDITQRKQVEETIRQLAYHDSLTGLPNRTLFNDRLTVALAQAQRHLEKLAVIMLDLDKFKGINDTLGHSIGDQLLQSVSRELLRLLRKSDTPARLGGDEFILLLSRITGDDHAIKVAQRALEALRKPFVCGSHELHITTSIGVAIYPDDGENGDTLVINADIAMYRAKELGRNNYQRYTPAKKPQS